jgi:hypothetical protein
MVGTDYSPLREAHQKALDALNSHADAPQPSQEISPADLTPTRPEGHYQQNSRWTDAGDMVSQQASANAMHKDNQERMNARDALNQHVDRTEAGEAPEKAPDITRAPENDIER